MKIILTHPTGNEPTRALIKALVRTNSLAKFNTTIAIQQTKWWLKFMPARFRKELLRRTYPVPAGHIQTHSFLEFLRLFLEKIGFGQLIHKESFRVGIDAVYRNLDKAVSKNLSRLIKEKKADAVYCYEDGALQTFTVAKSLGLMCIYDLPIAYWQTSKKLLTEEAQRLPYWTKTLKSGYIDSAAKSERKTRELQLADIVIVPSQFVLDSLPDWAKKKQIIVAPFGSPEYENKPETFREKKHPGLASPLRVLFAGTLSQRKGLGDLFTAMTLINNSTVELVVMGSTQLSMSFYKKQFNRFTYQPPRSHEEVLTLMSSCDILCLPSIVEGRALVIQEAMSMGLPVIITPNTGGTDLVIEGITGFLVPIRSPSLIAEKIIWFSENRTSINEMGKMARQHAALYTWERYGLKIINSITATVQV